MRIALALALAVGALATVPAGTGAPEPDVVVALTAEVRDEVPAVRHSTADGCVVTTTPGPLRVVLLHSLKPTRATAKGGTIRLVRTRQPILRSHAEVVRECAGMPPEHSHVACKCRTRTPRTIAVRYAIRNGILRFDTANHPIFRQPLLTEDVRLSGLHLAPGRLVRPGLWRGAYTATDMVRREDVQADVNRSVRWTLRVSRSRG